MLIHYSLLINDKDSEKRSGTFPEKRDKLKGVAIPSLISLHNIKIQLFWTKCSEGKLKHKFSNLSNSAFKRVGCWVGKLQGGVLASQSFFVKGRLHNRKSSTVRQRHMGWGPQRRNIVHLKCHLGIIYVITIINVIIKRLELQFLPLGLSTNSTVAFFPKYIWIN